MKKKIGLFGGTFDPIHNGHLYIAAYIKERFNLHEVIFMPAFRPPHKSELQTSSYEDRYNMLDIAIKEEAGFKISDLEKELNHEITYSVDIVEEILNKNDNIDLYFILGSDSLLDIEHWKGVEKLLKSVTTICFSRINNNGKLIEFVESLSKKYKANIFLLDNILIDISSSHIRGEIQNSNKSVRFLLPESVVEYIYTHNLYIK